MAELAPGAKRATSLKSIGCLISCVTCLLLFLSSNSRPTTTESDHNNKEPHLEWQQHKQVSIDTTKSTSGGWFLFDTETEDRRRVKSNIDAESALSGQKQRQGNSSNTVAKYQQQQQQQSETLDEEWIDVESFRENSSDVIEASSSLAGSSLLESDFNRRSREKRETRSREREDNVEDEEGLEVKRKVLRRKRSVSGTEQREFVGRKKRRLERRPILNEFFFPANLVQGMKFVLMCQVLDSGDSPVHIKWLKDNQEIGSDSIISSSNNNYSNLPVAQQRLVQTTDPLLLQDPSSHQVELVANEELGALSLVFRKVHQQHSGNYTCMASNHFGSSTFSSFMSVKVPPSWRIEPQDQESIMGEQITIDCQATGNPNPFIRWKFASFQQQPNNGALHLMPQKGSSQVMTTSLTAASGATSPAVLAAAAATATTTTTTTTDHRHPISGQPSFDSFAGSQLDLSSNQAGGDSQSYYSIHSQQQQQIFKLINSNHHMQTLENGSLSIRQSNKEHEGLYLCEADNGVEPNLVKVLRLIVHLQAQFAEEIQVIEGSQDIKQQQQQQQTSKTLNGLKSAKVIQNTTQVRLLCQLFGDQPLALDWLKDGQLIYTHSSSDLSSSSLSAPSSPSSAFGPASSSNSSSQSLNSNLAAFSPLNHPTQTLRSSLSDQVSSPLSSSSSSSASSSTLQTRYHVNTRKSIIRPQTGLDSELIIINVRRSDAAMFTCVARNAYGQAERKLRLMVQEPPEAPEVVDVAHIASRSISLRWLAPFDGNSPIVKYIIEYRRHTNSVSPEYTSIAALDSSTAFPGQSEKIITSSKSSSFEAITQQQQQQTQPQQQIQVQHTVHDLEPLARYSMRVVAVNSIGKSKPSVALSLRTEEEVPSVVPAMVEATVLSSKSIKLHWTVSYSPEREIIDGFFVGYRSFDTSSLLDQSSPNSQSQTVSSSSIVGNSLRSGSQQQPSSKLTEPTFTYKTIRLTNQQPLNGQTSNSGSGSGSYQQNMDSSNSRQQKQQQDASAFLTPISSATKNLPAQSTTSLPSQVANIFSSLNNNQQTTQHQVVVVSTFEYVIGSLERNTEYTILIQCFNQKGAGPTSDPVVFKTFMNDPPEKLALNADEITESSVRVSWRFLASNPLEHPIQIVKQYNEDSLVDGFVLTFAKLEQRSRHKVIGSGVNSSSNLQTDTLINRSGQINQASPIISNQVPAQPPQTAPSSLSIQGLEQWQAIQLAPQQRSHQLKNLECGTSYAMKIWAFNKIGKGEQSDLLMISTRGKAPVAPDRRSFISTNSTQVRLHLNAWYDGGCEIDKFMIQYRARGQQEWVLVSNNILKEQLNVMIRDLLPATSYDLFVSAQNQVGPTDVKYKFITLDSNGKQVLAEGHSLLGSIGGGSNENTDDFSDYLDPDGSVRREIWLDSPYRNSLMMFRQLLNSPFALTLSLCLFLALFILLVFYKFQGATSTSSSDTLSSSHKSNGSSGPHHHHHHHHPLSGGGNRRHSSSEANATMLDPGEGPMSIANGSISESPRINYQSHRLLTSESHYPVSVPSECGHYQATFCSATNNRQQQQQQQQQSSQQPQQQPVDYATRSMDAANPERTPYIPVYGQVANNHQGAYASVQRSATMDATLDLVAPEMQDQRQQQQQQQCLVQMLMMGPQQQQQHNEINNLTDNQNSYMAAALTTLARNKNNPKLTQQNSIYNNHGFHDVQTTAANNLTLNRQLLDYQRLQLQQPNSGHYSGKITTTADGNNNRRQQQSNIFSMATMNNNKQQNDRSDEIYPMSTFKQSQQQSVCVGNEVTNIQQLQHPLSSALINNYCSSNSTASTSGCGTATSGSISNTAELDRDQAILLNSSQPTNTSAIDNFHNSDNIIPYIDLNNSQELLIISESNNLISSQNVDGSNFSLEQAMTNKGCDKTSQYDVPYKFNKANNPILIDVATKEADLKSETTCY